MNRSESGEKATRQCWECLKRRLVCDHTLPHCKKCQKAGKECPGYDEQKPLQWVETGKVTSRRRKKDTTPKIYSIPVQQTANSGRKIKTSAESSPPVVPYIVSESEEVYIDLEEKVRAYWDKFSDGHGDKQAPVVRELAFQHATAVTEDIVQIFERGGRSRIEEIVSNQDGDGALKLVGSARGGSKTKDPLKALEVLLQIIRLTDVPDFNVLSSESSEVVQAVNYYNVRILPEVKSSGELAPNPAVIMFPPNALHILPPTIHHTLVCLSLNHYIHRLPAGADRAAMVSNRSKVYHHRGAAIRALSHYVGKDKTRCSDLTIASILMFMSMELQNPAFADWRSHASGLQQLIDLRGGLKALLKQAPYLAPTLVVYLLIVGLANTCSPSWDQIDVSGTPSHTIEDVSEMYNLIFPYILCPPEIFVEMLRTNQLRHKASAAMMMADIDLDHGLEANDLLSRVEAFSPEDWAQPGEFYEEWLLIGTIYQAAVAIYCTMSLQSLTVLPDSIEMNAMRSIHGDRLLGALRASMKYPRVVKFIVWPLVVAGVEAAYRGEATRNWIEATLTDMSRMLGTSSPLKARAVLRRYWQKAEPGWDECFDRPETVFVASNVC